MKTQITFWKILRIQYILILKVLKELNNILILKVLKETRIYINFETT